MKRKDLMYTCVVQVTGIWRYQQLVFGLENPRERKDFNKALKLIQSYSIKLLVRTHNSGG